MSEFDDRERTLILTALWNYKLQAGHVNAPIGRAADEQRGASEQAPGGNVDQIHALVAKMGGDPDLAPLRSRRPGSPNSEAGTTHASASASVMLPWSTTASSGGRAGSTDKLIDVPGAKVLITGAAGNLGFPLVGRLAPDNEVWGIARFSDPISREKVEAAGAITRAVDLASGDFGDFRTFEHYRLRVLLHAGGVTWPQRPSPPA